MQFVKKTPLITGMIVASLLFCVAIAFNVSPYLRGPSPYPPEWRWDYSFVNTFGRIYLPLLFIGASVWGYYFVEKRNIFNRKPVWLFLFSTVFLFVGLEFSVLFFSRAGVGVLIHRIIDPTINGYFSASLTIHSVPEF